MADKAALILFRALPEFKACAPWIQDLAETAFIRGMEEGKRQCGPNDRNSIIEECAKWAEPQCDPDADNPWEKGYWAAQNSIAQAIRRLKRTLATGTLQEKS